MKIFIYNPFTLCYAARAPGRQFSWIRIPFETKPEQDNRSVVHSER
ncbi:hypothetical protein ING2E5A_0342 [Petrimonas mucosa]|uniref:Uncharacterized protein n=1 Tax=Petrimonas mucosa TaxID=1642646 RepID=A0A1G4G3T0_9BACT|nr:hypothetical protein ING2E5A_0342 [Petrimonas mucosa]SFU58498.1 hypothetical protein SAMN05216364_10308 [Porphyromonadaceae bacterium KHP3R9]